MGSEREVDKGWRSPGKRGGRSLRFLTFVEKRALADQEHGPTRADGYPPPQYGITPLPSAHTDVIGTGHNALATINHLVSLSCQHQRGDYAVTVSLISFSAD